MTLAHVTATTNPKNGLAGLAGLAEGNKPRTYAGWRGVESANLSDWQRVGRVGKPPGGEVCQPLPTFRVGNWLTARMLYLCGFAGSCQPANPANLGLTLKGAANSAREVSPC